MLKKLRSSLIKNLKVLGLLFLIIFTIVIATLTNHEKNLTQTPI